MGGPAWPGLGAPELEGRSKPFLMLWFSCANVYARGRRERDGSAYVGVCPKCGAGVRFPVGEGGTNQRMFEVTCEGTRGRHG